MREKTPAKNAREKGFSHKPPFPRVRWYWMADERQNTLFDMGESPEPEAQYVDGPAVIREVRCRALLNRCAIADYSFNCYVGCTHACGYCYARFMQRFHPHAEEWGSFVDVRINAPQALARQLRRLEPGSVFTCSACDGWQPIEERYRLTRRCCELLLAAGFQLTVLTKSRLVLRDLDVFAGRAVRVGVTITTPDESWARIWEPGASSVADRLDVLRQAKAAGLSDLRHVRPIAPRNQRTPTTPCTACSPWPPRPASTASGPIN